MPTLEQLIHGCRLSQRTFRFRQVTHDLGFNVGAPAPLTGGDLVFGFEALETLCPSVSPSIAYCCGGGELALEGLASGWLADMSSVDIGIADEEFTSPCLVSSAFTPCVVALNPHPARQLINRETVNS